MFHYFSVIYGSYLLVYIAVLGCTMSSSLSPDFDEPSTTNVNYCDDDTDSNLNNAPNSDDGEDNSSTDEESELKLILCGPVSYTHLDVYKRQQ